MIDKAQMMEAVRTADAIAEEHNIEEWARQMNVDLNAVVYVADQRALRCAGLLVDRMSPLTFQTTAFKTIRLSPQAQMLMPLLTAAVIDGMAIGLTIAAKRERDDS